MKKIVLFAMVLIIVMAIVSSPKPTPQSVIPGCFAKEDCIKPIPTGYCGVDYDCIAGACYSEATKCKESCNNEIDDDFDTKIDCEDEDCWSDPYCPCSEMSYTTCLIGRCYCPGSKLPHWHIESSENKFCQCD